MRSCWEVAYSHHNDGTSSRAPHQGTEAGGEDRASGGGVCDGDTGTQLGVLPQTQPHSSPVPTAAAAAVGRTAT